MKGSRYSQQSKITFGIIAFSSGIWTPLHYFWCAILPGCAIKVRSMAVSRRRTWKSAPTSFTRVWFVPCVHVQMKLQLVRLRKRLPTVFTNAWFFLSMRAPHVTIMCRMWGKRFTTMTTFEWFFPTMLTYMRAQNGRGCECLGTVRTFVRAFTTVHSQVFVKTGRLWETLATFRALMRAVLLVNVQNVDPQSIAFFKGTITEVTWIFSVPLIDTSGVF